MLFQRFRKAYFFGYGADREPDMIAAITGRRPRVVGPAVLEDYELRVQELHEITNRNNIRDDLARAWGDNFKSYVIIPSPGAKVAGTLYRLSLRNRHLVDKWEMVDLGWYDKLFITVRLQTSGKAYDAETQVLGARQQAVQTTNGLDYPSWLQAKQRFMRIAEGLRKAQ